MIRIALVGWPQCQKAAVQASAAQLGANAIFIAPENLAESAPYDLVVAVGATRRKLTSHPTFLWVDQPLDAYMVDAATFADTCAFDGWLCVEPGAARVFQGIAVSLDRPFAAPIVANEPISAALLAKTAFQAAHEAFVAPFADTEIDVIMRTGGRAEETVQRAVDSLQKQSCGRIRLVLVRHSPADLSAVTCAKGRVVDVEIVDALGANRGRALAVGLAAVRSPLFAILDDDDVLLHDHFAGLLKALERADGLHRFSYSDVLRLHEAAPMGSLSLSILKQGPAAGPLTALLERLPSHSFLATSGTLQGIRTAHWDMATGEDSLLIAALLRQATMAHSPNATAVYSQGAEASGFADHPLRRADELALHAETFAWRAEIEARASRLAPDPLEHLRPAARKLQAQKEGRAKGIVVPIVVEPSPEAVITGAQFHDGAFGGEEAIFVRVPLGPARAKGGALYFEPRPGGVQIGPQAPWEVGLRLDVADYVLPGCSIWAIATVNGEGSAVGLGVVDATDALIERTDIASDSGLSAADVHGSTSMSAPAVILQAGSTGATFVRLAELRLGFKRDDLALAVGLAADASTALIREALHAHFDVQVEGAPQGFEPAVTPLGADVVTFRHPVMVTGKGVLAAGHSGTTPWDYFAQVAVHAAGAGGAGWMRVDIGATTEAFSAFLVDGAFTRRLSPAIEVRADKSRVELWLPTPSEPGWLVFQAGAKPEASPVSLMSVAITE